MIRLFLADDHELLRETLRDKFAHCRDIRLVGEAGSLQSLMKTIQSAAPDVLLLDVKLADGNALSAVPPIKAMLPSCKIVILTMYDHPRYASHAMELGADGFVVKGDSFEELLRAVHGVAKGAQHLSNTMRSRMTPLAIGRKKRGVVESLSPREFQVLLLLAGGMGCKQIAAQLEVSEKSVTTYRARILSKLGLSNNAELIRFALEAGLVE